MGNKIFHESFMSSKLGLDYHDHLAFVIAPCVIGNQYSPSVDFYNYLFHAKQYSYL